MSSLMMVGASSAAGKSTVCAMLCRLMRRRGMDVVPYKTLNLSLNSFVDRDGGEMGMSQAFQAWACGLEPDCRMNPVLIKPHAEGRMQTVIAGRVADGSGLRERAFAEAMGCFRSLSDEHQHIVVEGSGSAAEINLRHSDIANMRTARATASPVVIVGDIDSGGVFAGIYGTYMLLPEEDRALVKGFIINRFRGDASILDAALRRIEEETGMRCFGVMPYLPFRLPSEDSLDMGAPGELEGEDVRGAWMDNLDRLADEAERSLDVDGLLSLMKDSTA